MGRRPILIIQISFLALSLLAGCSGGNGGNDPTWQSVGGEKVLVGLVGTLSKIRVYQGTPYVAYNDPTDNHRASVMSYDGAWTQVGGGTVSSDSTSYLSLFNEDSVLYLSYEDTTLGRGCKATVMQYQTDWTPAGADFSDRQILDNSLFVANGKPYLAFQDRETTVPAGDFASVMWKDADWDYFGDAKFTSPVEVAKLSLAVYNGLPYLAYQTAGGDTVVQYYNSNTGSGSSWSNVDTGINYTTYSEYVAIGIGNTGNLYLAYNDNNGNGGKMAVQKFSGGSWARLPADGWVSTGQAKYGDLCVDGDTPYVAYFDGTAQKIFVLKYQGGAWVMLEANGIATTGAIGYLSLFVEGGVPYIAFKNTADDSLSVKKYQ